jgi:hypothetical protein
MEKGKIYGELTVASQTLELQNQHPELPVTFHWWHSVT